MIKNKKGEGSSWWYIIGAAIALTFFFFFLFPTNKIFAAFSYGTYTKLVEQRLNTCLEQKNNPVYKGYPDTDEDGYLDRCDNCPFVPNGCIDKDNLPTYCKGQVHADEDGDLFPFNCCGNDGSNYKGEKAGWCGDKAEEDDNPRKNPYYGSKKQD